MPDVSKCPNVCFYHMYMYMYMYRYMYSMCMYMYVCVCVCTCTVCMDVQSSLSSSPFPPRSFSLLCILSQFPSLSFPSFPPSLSHSLPVCQSVHNSSCSVWRYGNWSNITGSSLPSSSQVREGGRERGRGREGGREGGRE